MSRLLLSIFLTVALLCPTTLVAAQDGTGTLGTDQAEGFGSAATGGTDPFVVTSFAPSGPGSLSHALSEPGRHITFDSDGTIDLPSLLTVPADTTIDGRGHTVRLTGRGLWVNGVSNVIIRNLSHSDGIGVNDDGIRVNNGATDVWLDHLSFTRIPDEAIEISQGATDVTVSWVHITEQDRGILVGNRPDHDDGEDPSHVTIHHSWFDGVNQRQPRAVRWAHVHAYNNLITDWRSTAMSSAQQAQLLSEHNVFEPGTNLGLVTRAGQGVKNPLPGLARSVGDVVLGGTTTLATSEPDQVFTPAYDYHLDAAGESLAIAVRDDAGASSGANDPGDDPVAPVDSSPPTQAPDPQSDPVTAPGGTGSGGSTSSAAQPQPTGTEDTQDTQSPPPSSSSGTDLHGSAGDPTPVATTLDLPAAASGNSDLSIAISQLTFPDGSTDGTAMQPEVLLASETVFADALAAGALQDTRGLLLNDPSRLESAVLDEIGRLGVTTVRILGGEAAISATVQTDLEAAGLLVQRTFGPSRLETAAAIARLASSANGLLSRAFPAEGASDPTQAFADSLAVGGWAADSNAALVLTQTDTLSAPTQAFLEEQGGDLQVIGGQLAIHEQVVVDASHLVAGIDRVSGDNRFATAASVAAARGFDASDQADTVIVIEGQAPSSWAAGFTLAALAARRDAPIVLVNGDVVPEATSAFLTTAVDASADVACVASPIACSHAADLVRERTQQ